MKMKGRTENVASRMPLLTEQTKTAAGGNQPNRGAVVQRRHRVLEFTTILTGQIGGMETISDREYQRVTSQQARQCE